MNDAITKFLKAKPQEFFELNNSSWNGDSFFLCDITSHLNNLNIKLQEKIKLIFDLLVVENRFQVKLTLFKCQLLRGMLTHFRICSQRISPERHLAAGIKYDKQIELLSEEFNNKLILSNEEKLHQKIIKNSFLINLEEAPSQLQMELIDLQDSSV